MFCRCSFIVNKPWKGGGHGCDSFQIEKSKVFVEQRIVSVVLETHEFLRRFPSSCSVVRWRKQHEHQEMITKLNAYGANFDFEKKNRARDDVMGGDQVVLIFSFILILVLGFFVDRGRLVFYNSCRVA